jgi:hypothetical protein
MSLRRHLDPVVLRPVRPGELADLHRTFVEKGEDACES